MSLPSLIFVALPCFELITILVLGSLFSFQRVLALTILISVLAILFSQFRRRRPVRPAKGLSPQTDLFLRRIALILLIIPGLLTDLMGFILLWRPGRAFCCKCFCRRYCPNGASDIPLGLRLAARLFGLAPGAGSAYSEPETGTAGSSSRRTWNPFGRTETAADVVVEDADPDAATAYDGDISHRSPAGGNADEEIIDVDYTVR